MPVKDTTKNAPEDTSTRKLHKHWFDKSAATSMASQIEAVYSDFDSATFKRKALKGISNLEFNDRVKQFSSALHQTLPQPYPKAIKILVKSFPEKSVSAESVTDGWLQWPVGQFIADHGIDHFNESMPAMVALTQQFSSEFAVRPFLVRYPKETLSELTELTKHHNEHVRRWSSEGTRTRLPWGIKLKDLIENPTPIWRILKHLIDDESEYVRRSVANSINDLSKDHPEQVLEQCARWKKKNRPQRDWIIKHGLRGLIKAGHPDALKLVGFSVPEKITATLAVKPGTVQIGDAVKLTTQLSNTSKKNQRLMIDYVVHYVRKSGQHNEKVFKWKTLELAAGESTTLNKSQPMRQTTTRALYKGIHKIDLQVNGHRLANTEFQLK